MSKKDYIILASALKDSKPEKDERYPTVYNDLIQQWQIDTLKIANALQQDNTRFVRAQFLQACGYND